ncbi:MAG: FadR family transcriptional regulator [Candidatus Marinimicrobia bacterium]|nr:FadR family transcriptional regulator [Candidatus Neomarinimicrobiota bacterium]
MAYEFKAIKRAVTLSQEVQDQIERAILEKKFQPGEKLPTEFELAEMFGVSRTAIREALQMLRAKGLISVKKRDGIYIENYSPKNVIKPMRFFFELNFNEDLIKHLVEIRKIIEPEICRLAARNRSEDDLKDLEKSLNEFSRVDGNDAELEGKLDRDFHRIIARATHNSVIPIMMDPIYQILPKIKTLILAKISTAKDSAQRYHQLIFERIRDQDEEGAYLVMKKHMDIAESHSRELISKIK